jgi:hypothetical protein
MIYQVQIKSPVEREILIKNAINSSTKTEDFYYFRSSRLSLPIIRINIDIPVYRMENFRTFTDQKQYLSEVKGDKSFFEKGQEVESVQQVQHALLLRLAKKGKDRSISPVIDVLRKEKQQEPLLITTQGVVVNGNRRLAAMRELFSEGTSETESFRHVDFMVLPNDANADEIRDIEASLQGKPETKLDYDWIGDAQLINSQVNIHKSTYDVSQRLNRTEKDIKNTLQALAEANLYLKEWANSEGDYTKVTDEAEQFFKDLPKNLENKSTALATASRYIAWSLFDNRKELPSRIYDYNAAFGKLAEDVIDRFTSTLGISTESKDEETNDDFDIDMGDEDGFISYQHVIDAIKEKDNEENIMALIEAAQDAIETAKGQKSGDAALKAISQANSKLTSVDLQRANPNTYLAIHKQLEAIKNVMNKLSSTLSQLSPQENE